MEQPLQEGVGQLHVLLGAEEVGSGFVQTWAVSVVVWLCLCPVDILIFILFLHQEIIVL